MQLSPIQLLESRFGFISIQPIPSYEAKDREENGTAFSPDKLTASGEVLITELDKRENDSDYALCLTLKISPKEEDSAPYEINVTTHGLVRVLCQEQPRRKELALVNGASLLFGSVREMVTNITSRSLNGAFLLPTFNFLDLLKQKPHKVIETRGARPKKRGAETKSQVIKKTAKKTRKTTLKN